MASVLPQSRWRLAAERDDCTVFGFSGGPSYADENRVIGDDFAHMVDERGKGNVCLDFQNVEYVCSADLGKLIGVWKKLKDDARKLSLVNVRPHVFEVFHVIRFTKLMEIREGNDCPVPVA
jgi:anti-anti-sigma factor